MDQDTYYTMPKSRFWIMMAEIAGFLNIGSGIIGIKANFHSTITNITMQIPPRVSLNDQVLVAVYVRSLSKTDFCGKPEPKVAF